MERVLTEEERIRRGEEIYLRRRGKFEAKLGNIKKSNEREVKSSIKILKRVALQVVICLLLYCIFYLIYDTNYSFSEKTISKISEILNYDINFDYIYKNINEFIISIFNKDMNNDENKDELENESIEIESETSEVDNNIESSALPSSELEVDNIQEAEIEEDLNDNKYSLTIPVNGGYISSRFGAREATSKIVSTNHKGVDIAVPKRNQYLFCNGWKCCRFNCIPKLWKVSYYRKRRIKNSICSL